MDQLWHQNIAAHVQQEQLPRDSWTPSLSSVFFKNILFVQLAFAHWFDLRSTLANFASKRDEGEPWQLKVKLLSAASPFWGRRAF